MFFSFSTASSEDVIDVWCYVFPFVKPYSRPCPHDSIMCDIMYSIVEFMISAILALYSNLLKSCVVVVVVIFLISVFVVAAVWLHMYVSVCVFIKFSYQLLRPVRTVSYVALCYIALLFSMSR